MKAADVDHDAISFDLRAGAQLANHEESKAPPMTSDRRRTPQGRRMTHIRLRRFGPLRLPKPTRWLQNPKFLPIVSSWNLRS